MESLEDKLTLSRRNFLFTAMTVAPIGAAILSSGKAFSLPAAPLKLVSENDPTAKALQYTPDAGSAKLRTQKGATAAKDQTCTTCQFYVKQGLVGGKEVGKCQMIATGAVDGRGWCTVWSKRA
jgi:hypothetical protein